MIGKQYIVDKDRPVRSNIRLNSRDYMSNSGDVTILINVFAIL